MKRLFTAFVTAPPALAAVFLLPPWPFFLLVLGLVEVAAYELVTMQRRRLPTAPLWVLLLAVPVASLALRPPLLAAGAGPSPLGLVLGVALLTVGLSFAVLLSGTTAEEAPAALGVLCFGVPYLAVPVVSLSYLQYLDPWLVLLLLLVVWMGDAAAYYCGSRFGRHALAPRISPRKTWEGAAAGLAAGLVAATLWSAVHLGTVSWQILAVGATTQVAAQLGDLLESMLKRGAGVKDSGTLLPGHGGMLDRIDALLFAAPLFLVQIVWLGFEPGSPSPVG